jgi:dihydropteroate synthase
MLRCGSQTIDLSRPVVMGVLNVTPDSFSDGGQYRELDAAVGRGLRMVEEGAAIIDVGGESTRPGANPVDAEEEIRRVVPVIEKLRGQTDAIISVDTSKPQVMRAAAAAGAGLINDVRALSEEGALEAAVATQCAVCLMHMQGDPQSMQLSPHYDDVVNEVKAFLEQRVNVCRAAGIAADRIVIDPGFGFGKTLEHNLQLLRHLRQLGLAACGERPPMGSPHAANGWPWMDTQGLREAGTAQRNGRAGLRSRDGCLRGAELPIMVGLSRKSMVGHLTGRPSGDRVYGSVALAVMAVINGAQIVRVHDVGATVDALKTVMAVQG